MDAGGLPRWVHSELDIGEDVVSPYLWWRGFRRLDAVAITHAHADHMGGMAAVMANFRPRELWLGSDQESAEMKSVVNKARELGVQMIQHRAEEQFEFGGAVVRVLAPDAQDESVKKNDASLVMKLIWGNTSEFAVNSLGARNVYGHPRREVLKRLQESNTKTYRTDLNGAVSFYLDGKDVSPRLPLR